MDDIAQAGDRNGYRCFPVASRVGALPPGPTLRILLDGRPAAALANLLPLLGCGEEAAGLAFEGLADCQGRDSVVAGTLRVIAAEENVHDALIRHLQGCLPHAENQAPLDAARRFHIGLTRGGAALHLARIAALDSAVCTMLGRLLRPDGPIAADPGAASILRRIQRDEARHVRVTRGLALETGSPSAMRDAAAAAREGLANILRLAGDAFEDMQVDPASLDRDIRRLPDGLLSA